MEPIGETERDTADEQKGAPKRDRRPVGLVGTAIVGRRTRGAAGNRTGRSRVAPNRRPSVNGTTFPGGPAATRRSGG